jgi:glutamate racemase
MARMDGLPTKIGVLDSGIGGLSVLREIHRLLPDIPTVYVADQFHLPYGPRPDHEIRAFVFSITEFLIEHGAAVIVIACNTASAVGLLPAREAYPHIPFVGMEPAVKPAAEATRTGVVGVLATQTTANGLLYERVLNRYARDVQVITQVAPGLVTVAEANTQDTPEGRAVIESYIAPLIDAGADQIVLACTHFPFLASTIQEMVGADVTLVDPSPAIARQAARLLPENLLPPSTPNQYFTTGDCARFQIMLNALIGVEAEINQLTWGVDLQLQANVSQ